MNILAKTLSERIIALYQRHEDKFRQTCDIEDNEVFIYEIQDQIELALRIADLNAEATEFHKLNEAHIRDKGFDELLKKPAIKQCLIDEPNCEACQ